MHKEFNSTLQVLVEVTAVILIAYVALTNGRLFKSYANLCKSHQTLPVRVSLKRNVDLADAVLPSCYTIVRMCPIQNELAQI